MDTFIEEQREVNVQANQEIDTMERSLNKELDWFQSEIDQKFDNLQHSISKLANQQHVHQDEENLEKECLSNTMVEEHCQLQLQEELIETTVEFSEGLNSQTFAMIFVHHCLPRKAVERRKSPKSLILNHFPQS